MRWDYNSDSKTDLLFPYFLYLDLRTAIIAVMFFTVSTVLGWCTGWVECRGKAGVINFVGIHLPSLRNQYKSVCRKNWVLLFRRIFISTVCKKLFGISSAIGLTYSAACLTTFPTDQTTLNHPSPQKIDQDMMVQGCGWRHFNDRRSDGAWTTERTPKEQPRSSSVGERASPPCRLFVAELLLMYRGSKEEPRPTGSINSKWRHARHKLEKKLTFSWMS